MADLLEKSSAWLEGMREKHRTRPVTYCRGADCVTVPATVGKTIFQIARDLGPFERIESRDYLVTAAELVLQANPILPSRGDRIREEQDGKVYVYEVIAPGSEPCWRWSDDYRRTLRIHTKLIGTEDADG
jgi:hypothetical protein